MSSNFRLVESVKLLIDFIFELELRSVDIGTGMLKNDGFWFNFKLMFEFID